MGLDPTSSSALPGTKTWAPTLRPYGPAMAAHQGSWAASFRRNRLRACAVTSAGGTRTLMGPVRAFLFLMTVFSHGGLPLSQHGRSRWGPSADPAEGNSQNPPMEILTMRSQHQHLATSLWWLTLSLRKWEMCGSMMESGGVGPLQGLARAGRAAGRGEQRGHQQLPLRGFPFNGLVFVLYIRKTVNNKYCVIGLRLPLDPPPRCSAEVRESVSAMTRAAGAGSARGRGARLPAWATGSRAASQLGVAGWSQGLGRET